MTTRERKQLAISSQDPEQLERLSRDPEEEVRYGLIFNPNCPAVLLNRLSEDPDEDIRVALAELLTIPVEAAHRLSQDPEEEVREALAENPNIPAEILVSLAEDQSDYVVAGVAANPSTPEETKWQLLQLDGLITTSIANGSVLSERIINRLKQCRRVSTRVALAANLETPIPVLLDMIQQDPEEKVRNQALLNPKISRFGEAAKWPDFMSFQRAVGQWLLRSK